MLNGAKLALHQIEEFHLLIAELLSHIEANIKSSIVSALSDNYYFHLDSDNFISPLAHRIFFDNLDDANQPIWTLLNHLSFAQLADLFNILIPSLKNKIAQSAFNLSSAFFANYLSNLAIIEEQSIFDAQINLRLTRKEMRLFHPDQLFALLYLIFTFIEWEGIRKSIVKSISSIFSDIDLLSLNFPLKWKEILIYRR